MCPVPEIKHSASSASIGVWPDPKNEMVTTPPVVCQLEDGGVQPRARYSMLDAVISGIGH
jgi:hypothetical protein